MGFPEDSDVAFRFDSRLQLSSVEAGDAYARVHDLLQIRGLVNHAINRQRETRALSDVLYWDGDRFAQNWVPMRGMEH